MASLPTVKFEMKEKKKKKGVINKIGSSVGSAD